jgi:HAD superfamily hydrolase (TIGR01509 family)
VAAGALVLDLDGTVWDSYPWLARIAGGSRSGQREALRSLRDLRVPAARVLRGAGVTPARFRAICAEARDLAPYPGVSETLAELRQRGTPLGVVTNLPAWLADPMLACLDLRSYFRSGVDYGRTRRHKPYPDPIEACLDELEIEASPSVWYVGDTESDAEAANRAGISFAWASYGYGGGPPQPAAALIGSFPEILEL